MFYFRVRRLNKHDRFLRPCQHALDCTIADANVYNDWFCRVQLYSTCLWVERLATWSTARVSFPYIHQRLSYSSRGQPILICVRTFWRIFSTTKAHPRKTEKCPHMSATHMWTHTYPDTAKPCKYATKDVCDNGFHMDTVALVVLPDLKATGARATNCLNKVHALDT